MSSSSTSSSSSNDGSSSPFTGYWKLDRERSDPPTVHLESIGLSELAREAAEKMEIGMQIAHNVGKHTVLILQDSILGEKERLLTVGQEHQEQARDGSAIRMKLDYVVSSPSVFASSSTVSSSSSSTTAAMLQNIACSTVYNSHYPNLRIQVEWGNTIRIHETKALADNGNELHQEIIMMMKGNKVTRTHRVFVRTIKVTSPSPVPMDE